MSVLTRIKNNQITDSAIWANAKIIPGSIVGSLFNSNITVTSDFTITGNLTVQGSSTFLTVASTNTFVNDPLIVLNNAFTGSNSYDLGFIFNRGSDPNKAFYYDESSDEFRLITTTETGTTYGSIAAETNFENLRLGNLIAQHDVSTITLTATGLINTTGNISGAVLNGGAINSTGLINTTANISAAIINTGALNSTGLINTTGNVSAATVIAGQFNTTGNLSASQVSTATLKASGLTSGRVVFTSTDGLLVDNAGITFSANTLTVGGTLPITIDGDTATIATTSTDQDLILAPNGTGVVDFNATNAANLADPISNQDAVTLSYLNTQLSSAVTNLIDDDTSIYIYDDAVSPGWIEVTVDGDLVANITQYVTTLTNDVKVSNTTVSTTTTTGALVVTGGVGVAGNITVGSRFKSTDDTESTSTTTGAIITAGGVGIAKNLTVGGDATITGNLTVQGVLTAIESTTLEVTDAQITLAKGAGSSAAADGAGINVDYGNVGANITYTHATTSWNFNRAVIGSTYANFGGNVLATNFVGGGVNVSGNVLATAAVLNALTVNGDITSTGFFNTTANISAAVVNGGAINSTGLINTTGNVSAATVIAGQLNTTGNLVASEVSTGTLNATGLINTLGNLSASQVSTATLNATGLINTLGNISAAVINTGALNSTGFINTTANISAATIIAGQFNTTGNLVASEVSTATLNATGLINTTGNISSAVLNSGAINSTGLINTTGNISGAVINGGAINSTGLINTSGNISASRINADTLAATGTIWANAATDTTSLATGALIVAGGTAVGKTLWVGEGARINSTQSAESFHVLGQGTDNSLIYADFAKNAIVFGGANVLVQDGAVAKFNSDGAIVLPVGTSARRPGAAGNVDVAGMLRFSTTSNNMEFYDGTDWLVAGSEFTVITTNAFNGDGSTVAFTLSSSSTTAGTIVAVNGVVQIPVTAYSVSGTTLTFTEAPAEGDVVDARVLITTATVSSIASANGFNTFDVDTVPYANITAGISAATVRVSVDGATGRVTFTNDVLINGSLTVLGDSNGNINIGNEPGDRLQLRGKTVYDQTAINVPDTNLKELDSFSTLAFTTARYTVQVKNGGGVSAAELIVSHDTATSNIATYAVISTLPGTFQSNISSGTVRLFYTPDSAQNANIKLLTTYIV